LNQTNAVESIFFLKGGFSTSSDILCQCS